MSVETMRKTLLAAYPDSASWAEKVKKMSDAQIIAVYTRLKKEEK